jgi:hypothetical protein
MRPRKSSGSDSLLQKVAQTGIELRIDPNQRLIVFGFDTNQRDGRWQAYREIITQAEPDLSMRPEIPKPRRVLSSLRGQNVSKKSHPNFLPKSRQFLGPSFEYLGVPRIRRALHLGNAMLAVGLRPRLSGPARAGHPLAKQRGAVVGWLAVHPSGVISKGWPREATNPHCPDSTTATNSQRRAGMRRLIVPATGTGETLDLRFVVARSKFTSNAIQTTGKSP